MPRTPAFLSRAGHASARDLSPLGVPVLPTVLVALAVSREVRAWVQGR